MKAPPWVAALLLASSAAMAEEATATAEMQDRDGKPIGQVMLTQMPQGVVLHIEMQGLVPGWHGVHIHAVGKCEPPFTSAGAHFNPSNHKHGFGREGSHAGDLPNLFADSNGHADAEFFSDRVSLSETGTGAYLLGQNGTAIVVHAGRDDLLTDPTGNSGDRVACGVIK